MDEMNILKLLIRWNLALQFCDYLETDATIPRAFSTYRYLTGGSRKVVSDAAGVCIQNSCITFKKPWDFVSREFICP